VLENPPFNSRILPVTFPFIGDFPIFTKHVPPISSSFQAAPVGSSHGLAETSRRRASFEAGFLPDQLMIEMMNINGISEEHS